MTTVIKVENLGKKYTLRHQSGQQSYVALRDVLTDSVKNASRKFSSLFSRSLVPGPQSQTSEDFWALKDVSFEVKQGDRIGIIGRNGAGKSTLLKILSRITEPTTGSVRIKGRVASLLEVGTGFHPELTGRENIYLNGAILGMQRAEIKKKFDEIVDFAEIEKFLDTPVKRYSSGMYVRLAFAVAAHLEPEILVVDEVLAVGDAQFQKKCLGKMEDVSAKEGRTVLFVSHNMGAISALCETAILLSVGSLKLIGKAQEVIDLYMASFYKNANNVCCVSDRGGSGKAKIEDIYLVDNNGNKVDLLISGSKYCVVIKYNAIEMISGLIFKISIYNSSGHLVAHLNNLLSDCVLSVPVGKGEARCFIDNLPLAMGMYRVNASLNGDKLLDHIDGCISFNVENGDFFETGRSICDLKEICLLKHTWKIITDVALLKML